MHEKWSQELPARDEEMCLSSPVPGSSTSCSLHSLPWVGPELPDAGMCPASLLRPRIFHAISQVCRSRAATPERCLTLGCPWDDSSLPTAGVLCSYSLRCQDSLADLRGEARTSGQYLRCFQTRWRGWRGRSGMLEPVFPGSEPGQHLSPWAASVPHQADTELSPGRSASVELQGQEYGAAIWLQSLTEAARVPGTLPINTPVLILGGCNVFIFTYLLNRQHICEWLKDDCIDWQCRNWGCSDNTQNRTLSRNYLANSVSSQGSRLASSIHRKRASAGFQFLPGGFSTPSRSQSPHLAAAMGQQGQ